jgi:hypothetical protein
MAEENDDGLLTTRCPDSRPYSLKCRQGRRYQAATDTEADLGIRFFLNREGRLRGHALFDLAIDIKLCGYDLVRISIGDVVARSDIRMRAT